MSFIVKLKDHDGTIWYLTSADHEGLRYPARTIEQAEKFQTCESAQNGALSAMQVLELKQKYITEIAEI